ncbi:MAG: hypothetical protein CM1200mP3_12840 [Chloroflexota bacterium]|nr:MAG: hypothetical protein CM1200mP3_12840 [Chloroflexota bacterium]
MGHARISPGKSIVPNLILELKLMEIILHSWDIFNSIDPPTKFQTNGISL